MVEDRLEDEEEDEEEVEEEVEDTGAPGDPESRRKAPAAMITTATTAPMTAGVEIPVCLPSTMNHDN